MMEYHGGIIPPLARTDFEAKLANLSARVKLPATLGWELVFREYRTGAYAGDSLWVLQVADFNAKDNATGNPTQWRGRRWLLSQYMTDGEIAQTALMATLVALEHEVRETLLVDGQAIFDPHFGLDALVAFHQKDGVTQEREHVQPLLP